MPHRLLAALLQGLDEGEDPWQKLAYDFLHGNQISSEVVQEKEGEALEMPLHSSSDAYQFYRRAFLLYAIEKEHPVTLNKSSFKNKSELEGFGSSFLLESAYKSVLDETVSPPATPFWKEGPDLLLGLETALVTLVAELKREKKDFSLFLEQVALFDSLLDNRGRLIGPLWVKQESYSHLPLLFGQALLFASAAKLGGGGRFHLLAESSLVQLQKEGRFKTLPFQWTALTLLIANACEGLEAVEGECVKGEKLPVYRFGKTSALFNLAGSQVGVGVIAKGSARVTSMGPSSQPIGEPSTFGIDYQVGGLGYESSSVLCDVTEESMHFSGWSRCREGSWFELSCNAHRGRLTLGCRLEEKLNFLLYIQAKRALINESIGIERASLHRYKGPASSIAFLSEDETLTWFPEVGEEIVEVIPLAGGDHFWGGDFLLVCPGSARMTLV